MEFTLLGIRLLLALVFAVAAVGKLRDLGSFRGSLTDFGTPRPLAGVVAVLVPVAELASAGLLAPAGLAPWGAGLALGLLVVFTLVVGIALARGRAPDCRCFGQVEPAPIGAATIARNVALAAGAVLVLAAGPGPELGNAYDMWVTVGPVQRQGWSAGLAAVVVLGGLGWLAARLAERNAVLVRRVAALERQVASAAAGATPEAGLPVGSPAPPFDLPLLIGGRATVESLTAGGVPVVLVFSRTHCPACAELWPDIGRWQGSLGKTLKVIVVARGEATAVELKLIGTGVRDVVLAEDTAVDETYRVAGMPSAVVVAPDGTIDSATVMGPDAVRTLVRQRAGVSQ